MARPLKGTLSKWKAERLPLLKYQTVKRWVRQKTPGTLKHMLRSMDRLMKETGMDPDQFLEYAKKTDPLEVSDRLEGLSEKLKFPSSVRIGFIADIRSFLHHNGFNNLPKDEPGLHLAGLAQGIQEGRDSEASLLPGFALPQAVRLHGCRIGS